MRAVEYRAWDKKNKIMVYLDKCITWSAFWDAADPSYDDCILMQYLNLKDVNGQKIYEDDVYIDVEDPYKEHYLVDLHETIYRHYSDIRDHSGTGSAEWEIVGNIHENPELRERI